MKKQAFKDELDYNLWRWNYQGKWPGWKWSIFWPHYDGRKYQQWKCLLKNKFLVSEMSEFISRLQVLLPDDVNIRNHVKGNFHCCTLMSGRKEFEMVHLLSRLNWMKLLEFYWHYQIGVLCSNEDVGLGYCVGI